MSAKWVVPAAVGLAATAVAAVIAPLWTYAVSLALFGLPHVLVELRYVDERFGARLRGRVATLLLSGLAAVVVLRIAGLGGIGSFGGRAMAELLVGAGLAAVVVPTLARRSVAAAAVAAVACVATATAAVRAPAATLVLFALLHNLTPVGFLAERLRGRARARAMLAAALVFGAIPAWIGSGLAADLFAGMPWTADGPPGVGDLELHLGAFVPEFLRRDLRGLDLFRAAAFLQCMHYAVVLHVLPRLGGATEIRGSRLLWPRARVFAPVVAAVGALFLVGFALSFGDARSFYGVFAAVHAWVEIPILLAALAVPPMLAEVA